MYRNFGLAYDGNDDDKDLIDWPAYVYVCEHVCRGAWGPYLSAH